MSVHLAKLFSSIKCTKQIQHTVRCISLFGRGKSDQELDPEVQLPDTLVEKRKFKSGEDKPTMKDNLNFLETKRMLDTKKGYTPPRDVDQRMEKITRREADIPNGQDWRECLLTNGRLKYKLLTKYMEEFQHNIPNSVLTNMTRVQDAVEFFQTDVKTTHALEDMSKLNLPKNLHIQLEYLRFSNTDTMFNGRTAYPGRDTIVTSIKYKRKYQDIKTTKPKPGYVNHYYGF